MEARNFKTHERIAPRCATGLAQHSFPLPVVAGSRDRGSTSAGVGVYAAAACSVEQRINEITIRLAFSPWQLVLGLLIGGGTALAAARLLINVVHPYPSGIFKYLVVLDAVAVIIALAVLPPAFRSSRLNPIQVPRNNL